MLKQDASSNFLIRIADRKANKLRRGLIKGKVMIDTYIFMSYSNIRSNPFFLRCEVLGWVSSLSFIAPHVEISSVSSCPSSAEGVSDTFVVVVSPEAFSSSTGWSRGSGRSGRLYFNKLSASYSQKSTSWYLQDYCGGSSVISYFNEFAMKPIWFER